MGQNNRQRRAAKKRQRDAYRRAGAPSDAWAFGPRHNPEAPSTDRIFGLPSPDLTVAAAESLGALIDAIVAGLPSEPFRQRFLALPAHVQRPALDSALHQGVEQSLEHGWSPLDIHEVGRRRGGAESAAYLIHIAAAWTRRFPAATIDRRWSSQLRDLAAGDSSGRPSLHRLIDGREWDDAVAALTDLAVAVMTLPILEPVLPQPGSATPGNWASSGVDEAVLRRVRGLLAKAEATEFDEEAETLSAKAQELMTRHSIDAALAATPTGARETPRVRRVWLDAPYVRAKAVLVSEVAIANRCRVALSEKLGFVSLIGFGADLDTTDLLSTSLLVQATRAMQHGGSQRNAWGTSRTRSYRQSFLISFASRIGERLSVAVSATESAADAEHGGALLPVLASREQQVEDSFDQTFGRLRPLSISASDGAGWGAGRTAADLADLNVRPEVNDRPA